MKRRQVTYLHKSISLKLPWVDAGRETQETLKQKYFRGSEILAEHFQAIEDKLLQGKAFLAAVDNQLMLGLFLKLSRSYRSLLLLLDSNDQRTIQFISEQLCEAVVMLAFLAEETIESSLYPYFTSALKQAYCLYTLLEEKRLQSPQDAKLQALKAKLQHFIERSQQQLRELSDTGETTAGDAEGDDNTEIFARDALSQRAAIVGIKVLLDSSRTITSAVNPASLLDLELFYLESLTSPVSCFDPLKLLRDTSHACLHATTIFLDVIDRHHCQEIDLDLRQINGDFNTFFKWFHELYILYQSA
ncbi:MAG: hypothetical protein ACFB4I_15280 [Cyanophyceae cyanobacterium]